MHTGSFNLAHQGLHSFFTPRANAAHAVACAPATTVLVLTGHYAFLNAMPNLVNYRMPNYKQALRNANTPRGGNCGWAALSFARDGHNQGARALRTQVLECYNARSFQEIELAVLAALGRDPEAVPLQQEEVAELLAVPAALTTAPNVHVQDGFAANLTTMGIVVAANAVGRPIHTFMRPSATPDVPAVQTMVVRRETMTGAHLRIHSANMHCEAIVGGSQPLPSALATTLQQQHQQQQQQLLQ